MLYEREEVALSFNLLKDGQYLGSLSGRLSHRFRNEVTGDELLHAAVHGQSAELIEYLIEVSLYPTLYPTISPIVQ